MYNRNHNGYREQPHQLSNRGNQGNQGRQQNQYVYQNPQYPVLRQQQVQHQVQSQIRQVQQNVNRSGVHLQGPTQTRTIRGINTYEVTIPQPVQQANLVNRQITDFMPNRVATNTTTVTTMNATRAQADKVKIKQLPFFDIEDVILKQQPLVATRSVPASAGQTRAGKVESLISFSLTYEQADKISCSREYVESVNRVEHGCQIMLRFAALKDDEEQDDDFPPQLVVKLNSKGVALPPLIPSNYPNQPPKQPSKPLNVTIMAKLRPADMMPGKPTNVLSLQWLPDTINNKQWVFSLHLVRKLTANDLFERMRNKGYLLPDVTRNLIADVMKPTDDDPDLAAPESMSVTVACPVGKSRMTYPCRSSMCRHVQCFDAMLYLQMSEKKPVWSCPVCIKKIKYETISIDQYFVDVIKALKPDSENDIEIRADGSWKVIEIDKDKVEQKPSKMSKTIPESVSAIEMISISDDDDDFVSAAPPSAPRPVPAENTSPMDTLGLNPWNHPSTAPPPPARRYVDDDVEVICLSD